MAIYGFESDHGLRGTLSTVDSVVSNVEIGGTETKFIINYSKHSF